MYTVNEHLRARLLRGVERVALPDLIETETNELFFRLLQELLPCPFDNEFFTLMQNNLLIGASRYCLLCAPGRLLWDYIGSSLKRLDAYAEDSANSAHLADIAALSLVEFTTASKPGMYYVHIGQLDRSLHFRDAIIKHAGDYRILLNRAHLVHLAAYCLIEFLTRRAEKPHVPLSSDSDRIGTESP